MMTQRSKTLHRLRSVPSLSRTKHNSSPIPIRKKEELDLKLQEKFTNFMVKTKFKKLKQKLCYFYGRHFAINYQPKYNFSEEWQRLEKKEQKNLYELIQSENTTIQLISFFIMLINTFIVWSLSLQRFFRKQQENNPLFMPTVILGIIDRLVSAGLKIYLNKIGSQNGPSLKLTARVVLKNVVFLGYFVTECSGVLSEHNPIMILLQILLSIYMYLQAKKYYKHLKTIEFSLIYQYQFKIMDLMINLFIIAHSLAILLFIGTFMDNRNNWIVAIQAEADTFLGKYLYSLYFCFTTILTIGYGDITPKNKLELIIVIIVQLFGVIIFGYLVNQIGHSLSSIRKSEENLQKDLTVLKKIQNFYSLESKLASQAKGYLVTNQNAVVELTPDEEKNLLMKLNEQLRNKINAQKSLSIIKTSIFFLCRWSKEMQTNVAQNLQRALYLPNERLLQPPSKERIYIIKKGKIDIFCIRFPQNRKQYRRLMKTIKVDENSTINQNIYGYTSVISLRPCSLDAISSEVTSCYYIQKDAFLKCVNSSQADFEYYHEIKCKIDQSELCQAHQTPSILNIREHYNPSRTILIRKMKVELNKFTNERLPFMRWERRKIKKHHFKNLSKTIQDIQDKIISSSSEFIEFPHLNKNQNSDQLSSKDKGSGSEKSIEVTIRQSRNYQSQTIIGTDNLKLNTINIESKTDLMLFLVKSSFHHYFERAQEYKNFFECHNLNEVIKRLQNQNYKYIKEAQGSKDTKTPKSKFQKSIVYSRHQRSFQ